MTQMNYLKNDTDEALLPEEQMAKFRWVCQELYKEIELDRKETAMANKTLADYAQAVVWVRQRKVILGESLAPNA